jgi:hypothetical protein
MAAFSGSLDFSGNRGLPYGPAYRRTRLDELEGIVSPLVTSRKTPYRVEFKGKRRFLKAINDGGVPFQAVLALQALYALEAAREAGDAETAVQCAIAFAQHDASVQELRDYKTRGIDAIMSAKHGRSVGGRNGKKLADETNKTKLEFAFAKHCSARNRNQKIADEFGVSAKTIERRLKEYWILDNSKRCPK